MAFGSGFTAIKILPSGEKCDFTKRDFFTFGNDYPILIKWKNRDTLQVKCIGSGAIATSQPFLSEIMKWKDWTFEVEYFPILSTGTNGSDSIDNYNVNPNSIEFSSEQKSLVFDNSEIAIELDSNEIYLRQFKVDTFKTKKGFALSDYKFAMNEKYRMKDFYGLQPFITTRP
jgi:hypothetical protein